MKVNLLGNNFYKNKILKRGLEFAADNGALFGAGASLVFSTIARPIAIYATPKTDKENRKLACAKSFASSAVGFSLMCGVSLPISNSVRKIDNNPDKYLASKTIEVLKSNSEKLSTSKAYKFATQLFKLGVGALAAIPKALITCTLIPPIMSLIFKQGNKKEIQPVQPLIAKKDLTFTGLPKEPLTKGISKALNSNFVQKLAERGKDTNYAMHITALTDTAATVAFIGQTNKSKKIEKDRKLPLIYNSAISTGLSIAFTYILDKASKNSTDKFIDNFKQANKESKKLDKYIEGIRIAKPMLILGAVYYGAIPFVSTFFAERIGKIHKQSKQI